MKAVRVLEPGEKYRVYDMDDLFGGQLNLGSKLYITNIQSYVDFLPAQ
ncbi:hypothetical protein RCG23_14515 [Neobacillus sp. PS3-34]|nr:hypothetical protein [Neobacillus sp. PS3-34]WML46850.1 hypothetical protein RCG23_14515 [Neobacillus sp. PS3-34]